MLDQVRTHLQAKFPKNHVDAMLRHYERMTADFQTAQWEESAVKGGKLVEAALKAIASLAGVTFSTGRNFKAGKVIDDLANRPSGSCHDSLRRLLPRACRLAYDIASNRGARHDPDEVDSNESDATVMMATCAWMCGEMIRVATSGAVTLDDAQKLVDGLAEKRYPVLEQVEGQLWFHGTRAGPRDIALVMLHHRYPGRMPREELLEALKRHGVKKPKAQVMISRLKRARLADERDEGLYLLAPGRMQAEEVLQESGQRK